MGKAPRPGVVTRRAEVTRHGARRFKLAYPGGERATRFYRSAAEVGRAVKEADRHLGESTGNIIVTVLTWDGCKPSKARRTS